MIGDLHCNVWELKKILYENYDLEDAIVDRLEFGYTTKIGNKGNSKWVKIMDDDDVFISNLKIRRNDNSALPNSDISIDDLKVQIRYILDDEIEVDASCDSEFMIPAMDRVGLAIRKAYHWIPASVKCYLVMDNAGGHGTNEAKEQYVNLLETKYNITTIFQIPRSPYTNVLDLGVWMSLQAAVEREHYLKRCNVDDLVNSVMTTWKHGHIDHAITKIF